MSDLLHIVMVHNRYQFMGGEDISTDLDIELLRNYGHKVTLIEVHNDQIKSYSQWEKLRLFIETPWNFRIYKQMRSELQKLQPDIVHVQNFFPLLSPSVHSAARSLNIPTVQHLHNFRLGCLNGYLLREGKVCEVCVGKNPWRGLLFGCYRDSPIASLAVWAMLTLNRWRGTWQKDVSAFVTPSYFAAQKLQEIGISSMLLHIKPNVIYSTNKTNLLPSNSSRICFLFVGRLSPEKGIMHLLEAWHKLSEPHWQLKIVGNGCQKLELEQQIENHRLENVALLGQVSQNEVTSLIESVTAIVVPSQCYETFGRVVIEAFASGKPVIASKIGALAELITPTHNGFLLPHDRIDEWVECLNWCGNHPEEVAQMGENAFATYRQFYTTDRSYAQIMNIYTSLLNPQTDRVHS